MRKYHDETQIAQHALTLCCEHVSVHLCPSLVLKRINLYCTLGLDPSPISALRWPEQAEVSILLLLHIDAAALLSFLTCDQQDLGATRI